MCKENAAHTLATIQCALHGMGLEVREHLFQVPLDFYRGLSCINKSETVEGFQIQNKEKKDVYFKYKFIISATDKLTSVDIELYI